MNKRISCVVAVLASGLALAVFGSAVPASATPERPDPGGGPAWEMRHTGTDAQFRGLDAVSGDVAWLAGSSGTVLRTDNGGRDWQDVSPPGAGELEFRDVEAFGARRAVVLAIGEGDASRIYRTDDGGRSWQQTFVNDDPRAFYNCTAFFDSRHGLTVGDPVDGKFSVLETSDGGRTWSKQSGAGMPAAKDGEFNFAASGTCLVAGPGGRAWFASGGTAARVFRTDDGGRTWDVTGTPVADGESAGIYSLAFSGPWHGVAVGGDYTVPGQANDATAVTSDGGRNWTLVDADQAPAGYRSGSAWLGWGLPVGLAVGPSGSDVSFDGGWSWRTFDTGSFDSVDCVGLSLWSRSAPPSRVGGWESALFRRERVHRAAPSCWASGPDGRAARLTWGHP